MLTCQKPIARTVLLFAVLATGLAAFETAEAHRTPVPRSAVSDSQWGDSAAPAPVPTPSASAGQPG